jgi:hypothetical protein
MYETPNALKLSDRKWQDLTQMYKDLWERFPQGFPFDRNGVRLGIASLEDEIGEVYEEWSKHKRNLGNCRNEIRTELLQVAAVALMIVEGIDNPELKDDRETS